MQRQKSSINATRAVVSTFGVLAGLAGLVHGFFETLQGNVAAGGIGLFVPTVIAGFAHDIQRRTDSYQTPSMSG